MDIVFKCLCTLLMKLISGGRCGTSLTCSVVSPSLSLERKSVLTLVSVCFATTDKKTFNFTSKQRHPFVCGVAVEIRWEYFTCDYWYSELWSGGVVIIVSGGFCDASIGHGASRLALSHVGLFTTILSSGQASGCSDDGRDVTRRWSSGACRAVFRSPAVRWHLHGRGIFLSARMCRPRNAAASSSLAI